MFDFILFAKEAQGFIAEILYPKKCVACGKSGSYICAEDLAKISFLEYQLCGVCQKGSIDGLTHPGCKTPHSIDGIISSIAYRGIVKKLLYQFKYRPFLTNLKSPLGKLFYEGLIQQEAFSKFIDGEVYLTFVPLHPERERKRGYNQSELLANELSKKIFAKNILKLLIRNKKTVPQFKLSKNERRDNLKGAFSLDSKFKTIVDGKKILLVDDITTTGSTLRECAKILKRSGAKKVLGITLAHEG